MESMPDILDISSDEEPGLEEGPKSSDYEWIREFLGVSDEELDDPDEIFVVRDVRAERKSKSSRPTVKDLDDDCVVLDGDPENHVSSVNEPANETDELFIVGEKGQIACRDYPHPRHLCATFPFSSTPHERHCKQCHCYVCDSLAPCLKWGTGISSTDHCHATEKLKMWKIERENFMLRKSASLPASTNYGNPSRVGRPQHNQVLPLDIIRLSSNSFSHNQASRSTAMRTCSPTNPIPQNQGSRSTIMRACSSSLNSTIQSQVSRAITVPMCSSTTNFTIPNGTSHGRYQQSVSTSTRNRYQAHSVPRLLGIRNNAFQRNRRRGAISLGPQFPHFPMTSKGGGSVGGTLSVNYSTHGSSGYNNHVNPSEQYDKYHDSARLSNDRTCNGGNNGWFSTNSSSYPFTSSAHSSLNYIGENTEASETQAFSQPSHLKNSHNLYQSCIQGNDASSKYVPCPSSNQYGNEHQIESQNENASANIIQCGNSSQGVSQGKPYGGNQGETADLPVFGFSWNENTCPSIEPLIESSHLQRTGSINQPPNVKESDNLFAGSTNLNSLVDFENWLMENDGALSTELNIPSSDSITVDMGSLLFDFDTSWNGLAHA